MMNNGEWGRDGEKNGSRGIKFGFIAVVLLMLGLGMYGCISFLSYEPKDPEWVQTTHDRELWKRFGDEYGEIASKMEHHLERKYGVFPHDIIGVAAEISGAPFPSVIWYQGDMTTTVDGREIEFYVRSNKEVTYLRDTYLLGQVEDEYLAYMNDEMQKYFGRTKIFMESDSEAVRGFNNNWATKEEFWNAVRNHDFWGPGFFVYVDYDVFNGIEGFEDALKLFWQDWHKGKETEPIITIHYLNKKMFELINEDTRKKLAYSQYRYAVLIETTNERANAARYFSFEGDPVLAVNHIISSLKPEGQSSAQIAAYNLNVAELRYELPMPESGTITEDGIYTAPDKEGEYLIRVYYVPKPSVSVEYTQIVGGLFATSDLIESAEPGIVINNRVSLLENGEQRKIRVSFFNMEPVKVKYELDHEYESEYTNLGQDIGTLTKDGVYTAPQEAPVDVRYFVYAVDNPDMRASGFFRVFKEENI
jgi:hypothetical protein